MSNYIVQVLIFQGIFLLLYKVFFKHTTFFQLNRAYLLLTPICALVLPNLALPVLEQITVETLQIELPTVWVGTPVTQPLVTKNAELFEFGITGFYFLGVSIALVMFCIRSKQLASYLRLPANEQGVSFIPDSSTAFTFFHRIFIGTKLDVLSRKQILEHERVHAKRGHSWDILYFELWRMLAWFNPLVYWYQTEMSLLHEFQADAEAQRGNTKKAYYTTLLQQNFGSPGVSFSHSFYKKSFIKKRILMLSKSTSSRTALLRYAVLVPVIAGMLFYVSCSGTKNVNANTNAFTNELLELRKKYESKETVTEEEYQSFSKAISTLVPTMKPNDAAQQALLAETLNEMTAKRAAATSVAVVEREPFPEDGVPFAKLEQSPGFPGCEQSQENEKECFAKKVSSHVNYNFNVELAKTLKLDGVQKIYVMFAIEPNGTIRDIRARSSHPQLEAEAIRVIKTLPQMKPGRADGKPVRVLYSLPIKFAIGV